jgi:hypothetical protein
MKRTLAVTALALVTATTAFAQQLDGAWTASKNDKNDGKIYLSVVFDRSQNGNTMPMSNLSGLTEAQVRATTQTPVHFEMKREAGNIVFDGTFRNGKGAGQFDFQPNRNYIAQIRSLGLDLDEDEDDRQLFHLAMHDVSTSFIREMRAAGFNVKLDKYIAMRIFNVDAAYVREMRDLGYNLTADKLIETRIHNVSPQYIREMRAAGWNDSIDGLVQNRIFKVTPEFAAEWKRLGYDLDQDDLVNFRIHKVNPEFVKELAELGYKNVPADRLVEMRIHRVTAEFIRELQAAGYRNVPIRKMIDMRIHGIDAQFIEKMNKVQ